MIAYGKMYEHAADICGCITTRETAELVVFPPCMEMHNWVGMV